MWPSGGYAIAFYGLSLALQDLPLGVAYAIWAGVGTALTAFVGIIFYKETLNMKKSIGILMIICGVVLMNSPSDKTDNRPLEQEM